MSLRAINGPLSLRQDELPAETLFPTGELQRFSTAAIVDAQILENRQCLWVLDDPIGNAGVESAFHHHDFSVFPNECPVFSPATNSTNATAPRKNTVSPGTRIQRNVQVSHWRGGLD